MIFEPQRDTHSVYSEQVSFRETVVKSKGSLPITYWFGYFAFCPEYFSISVVVEMK